MMVGWQVSGLCNKCVNESVGLGSEEFEPIDAEGTAKLISKGEAARSGLECDCKGRG